MTAAGSARAVRLRVHGRVQGVFYRSWTVATARTLGLAGWVRNRRDGSVEILAIGDATAIDDLVELCGHGPPAAQVTGIDRCAAKCDGSEGFCQLPTS